MFKYYLYALLTPSFNPFEMLMGVGVLYLLSRKQYKYAALILLFIPLLEVLAERVIFT